MVDVSAPWFTRPWIRVSETNAMVGGFSYLGAGLASAVLAVIAEGSVLRGLALLAGVVFTGLGVTLLATVSWRRRNEEAP